MNGPAAPQWRFTLAAATDRGLVRDENQDVALADGWCSTTDRAFHDLAFTLSRAISCAVIDGMGGHRGGALAAFLTAHVLGPRLADILDAESSDALAQRTHEFVSDAGDALGTPRMGAAFAALVIGPDGYQIANVGDCRVYRATEGVLGLLSVDDVGMSRADPARQVLTQSIGGGGRQQLDSHWFAGSWVPGARHRFLLASDGLAVVDMATVTAIAQRRDIRSVASGLIRATHEAGAPDNVTVIVVEVAPFDEDAGAR
ncbi:PP2C family protein-serine/threonine phosphatase [Agromyces sp. NPDC056523]|uniref:PP2C family protein-serine/threonine phosphatase n=1 Tax=Agromyces sp. NPDC056523 TaxID=3345850 RepID=UPI00367014CB